jgi:hypothetical protein
MNTNMFNVKIKKHLMMSFLFVYFFGITVSFAQSTNCG